MSNFDCPSLPSDANVSIIHSVIYYDTLLVKSSLLSKLLHVMQNFFDSILKYYCST